MSNLRITESCSGNVTSASFLWLTLKRIDFEDCFGRTESSSEWLIESYGSNAGQGIWESVWLALLNSSSRRHLGSFWWPGEHQIVIHVDFHDLRWPCPDWFFSIKIRSQNLDLRRGIVEELVELNRFKISDRYLAWRRSCCVPKCTKFATDDWLDKKNRHYIIEMRS